MFHSYKTEKITHKARKPAIIAGGTTDIYITCYLVVPPKKITPKDSHMAENLEL